MAVSGFCYLCRHIWSCWYSRVCLPQICGRQWHVQKEMGGVGHAAQRARVCKAPICGNSSSALISHVPMQWVVEIKLAEESIAYVSQKFCGGDDVIAQGPSLGSLPGFDCEGSRRVKTWQCSFASVLLFSFPSFLLKRLFLTIIWGKQSRDCVLAIKIKKALPCYFTKQVFVAYYMVPHITQ